MLKKLPVKMKKTAVAVAVSAIFSAAEAQSAAKENTWYTGAKMGWSVYHDTGLSNSVSGMRWEDDGGRPQPDQPGAGAFLGYQLNPSLGVEVGYDWLGRMSYKGDASNGAFKAHGMQLAARLSWPVTHDIDIYTRLGGMAWRADAERNFTDSRGARQHWSGHDTGISPLAAAGIEYAMTENVATRLDYQWINNIGDGSSTGARPDNSMLSLGISWRFGQQHDAVSAVMAAPEKPEIKVKNFTLNSDVLFDFNKSVLKQAGYQEIDSLYSGLDSRHSRDAVVAVVGFTDHLGEKKYNQKLSEERAYSVVNYLVSKGIPADKITARGMGESVSSMRSDCKKAKTRNAMIDCLSSDRRVEIEIRGTGNVII